MNPLTVTILVTIIVGLLLIFWNCLFFLKIFPPRKSRSTKKKGAPIFTIFILSECFFLLGIGEVLKIWIGQVKFETFPIQICLSILTLISLIPSLGFIAYSVCKSEDIELS
jgi:hypothetical protein